MTLLDLSLLGLLADQPLHGYELSKRLRELGRGAVSYGALYPALGRLDRKGLIVTAGIANDTPAPMTGSLGAEVARMRRGTATSSGRSPRKRKVYTITDTGRSRLHDLLVERSDDDRTFATQLAFATHLSRDERLALFEHRRHLLARRLAADSPRSLDRYRDALRARDRLAEEAEVVWLEELIRSEPAPVPSSVDTIVDSVPLHETVGGSRS